MRPLPRVPGVFLRSPAIGLLIAIGIIPAPGRAQSGAVEIRQFQPTPFSEGYLRLDGTAVLPAWKLHAGFDVDYAWKPLVLIDVAPSIQRARKTTYNFIDHAVGADLSVAMGIAGRLEVGALIPLTLFQTGETAPDGATPGTFGLENPKVGAKIRILGPRGGGAPGFGLGASLLVSLPWGLGGAFIHGSNPGVDGRLFGELARETWGLRAGAGYRLRAATEVFDIAVGDELTFAAGGHARLSSGIQLFAELAGTTNASHPLASVRQTPVELLLGGRREVGARWLGGDHRFWLTLAAGPGLSAGYGSPAARAVAALTWSNRPPPHPAAAPPPELPRAPETCPGGAGCPKKEPPPPSDRDKDGILDDDDECPDEPEDKDGFEDDDGCPDPDNDKDGILDAADKCPNESETINGFEDDDGCPDKGAAAVRVGPAELEILKPIFFETDHSRVRHAFYNVLSQIALTLKAHPEIGRCAVEGHTDDTGPPEWNQKLSLLRAEAVVEFLVDKGVERARLTAIGHGEKLPWAPNDTEEGRARNRRVIFHIEGVNTADQKREEGRQRVRAHKAAVGPVAPGTPPAKEPGREPGRGEAPEPAKAPGPGKTPASSKAAPADARRPLPAPSAGTREKDPDPTFVTEPRREKQKTPRPAPSSDKPPSLRDLLRLPER